MDEEWRKITRFPEYSVSSYGRVRRDTTGYEPFTNCLYGRYEKIKMWDYDRYYYRYIHELVAEAFLQRPSGIKIIHKNGNLKDNRATNLELVKI